MIFVNNISEGMRRTRTFVFFDPQAEAKVVNRMAAAVKEEIENGRVNACDDGGSFCKCIFCKFSYKNSKIFSI